MNSLQRKKHWEKIYNENNINHLSWYERIPSTSLNFLKKFNLAKTAKIIDVGGGDSFFVDNLISLGYKDISLVDISQKSLDKIKLRLGAKSRYVKFINADISNFNPKEKFDFWHDRAAFHFLINEKEIQNYINTIKNYIKPEGFLVIGTFSENGPEKCSGLKVRQYSENSMSERLKDFFKKIKCIAVDHKTPFNTIQNFIFCSFQRLSKV